MADPTLDNIVNKRAAFGANFLGTTNLARRRRYQEDIEAARQEEEAGLEQQFQGANRLAELADPLKARALRLNERKAITQEDQFNQRMTAEEQRFQLRMQKDREVLSLRERQAEIAERRELRSATDARRILENTEAVEDTDFKLRSEGVLPGSTEYAQAMVEKVIRNPYIDPGYRKTILEQANVDVDPEEVMKSWAAKGRRPVITARISADGKESFTIRDAATEVPEPQKLRRELERDLDSANKRLLGASPEMQGYWNKRIKETNAELLKLDSAGQPTVAQPAQAGAPKPIDRDTAASILKEFGGDKDKARAAARERGFQF